MESSFLDSTGAALSLGHRVGRAGGEGTVREVVNRSGLLAKIYHAAPHLRQQAKLRYLIRIGNHKLRRFAAWPCELILDRNGTVRGFMMPRVIGDEVHQVYHPKERATRFPDAKYDFLVHVARNCAAAFDEVHRLGVVIGDVNEGNLLVKNDGTVTLIDCDSYQARSQGETWACDVGVPFWTAPELQGRVRRGLIRARNSDLFSLALLIFHFLFMGRHPFTGVSSRGDVIPLEQAIAEYKFVFSASTPLPDLHPPPACPAMVSLPPEIRALFDRAFLRGSEREGSRPEAKEWVMALDRFGRSLQRCSRNEAHLFWAGAPACPWCTVRDGGGPDFFAVAAANVPFAPPPAIRPVQRRARFRLPRRAFVLVLLACIALLGALRPFGPGHPGHPTLGQTRQTEVTGQAASKLSHQHASTRPRHHKRSRR